MTNLASMSTHGELQWVPDDCTAVVQTFSTNVHRIPPTWASCRQGASSIQTQNSLGVVIFWPNMYRTKRPQKPAQAGNPRRARTRLFSRGTLRLAWESCCALQIKAKAKPMSARAKGPALERDLVKTPLYPLAGTFPIPMIGLAALPHAEIALLVEPG